MIFFVTKYIEYLDITNLALDQGEEDKIAGGRFLGTREKKRKERTLEKETPREREEITESGSYAEEK